MVAGPSRRATRGAERSVAVVGLALLLGCGDGSPAPRPLDRSERFGILRDLEFFPRSPRLGGPFFLDRFETTRLDWHEWLVAGGRRPPVALADSPDNALPAVGMDLLEARAFAGWRLGRLPRYDEWLYAATGGGLYRRPWGDVERIAWANTQELGIAGLTPVGAFESGRQPGGPYDLIGNAAEWTETPDPRLLPIPVRIRGLEVLPSEVELGLRVRTLSRCAPWFAAAVPGAPWPFAWLVAADSGRLPRLVAAGWTRPVSPSSLDAAHFWADSWWYELRRPSEASSVIGVRVATDPPTLLERLAGVTWALSPAEDAALRTFLRRGEVRAALRDAALRTPSAVRGPGAVATLLREELAL